MKARLIFRIIMIFAAITAMAAPLGMEAKRKTKGSAVFTEQSHNFGMVKEEGGPVSCVFDFTNKGDGNLVIINATADCGCTRPEYPDNPIAPGKSGKIKVTYNPLGRPGAFDKTITIKTNGTPSKIRLKIKGTVVPKKK